MRDLDVILTVASVASFLVWLLLWAGRQLRERRLATITRLAEAGDLAAARRAPLPSGAYRGHALLALARGAYDAGDYAEARRLADEAAARDHGDAVVAVNARYVLALTSNIVGDYDDTVRRLGEVIREDWARNLRADVALTRGEDELALELLSARRETPTDEAARLNGLGRLRLQRGELTEADRLLAESLDLQARLDPSEAAPTRAHTLLLRAHTAIWSGRAAEAVEHVRAALACLAAGFPAGMRRGAGYDVAAIVLAAAGSPAEAAEHLAAAEAGWDGTRPQQAQLLWARAEVEAARGHAAAARTTFNEAIELLETLGEAPKVSWLRGRLTELGLA